MLGSGSLSFEMIRALVERLPVMICPRWVSVEAQPIAVEDVIAFLAEALDLPDGAERVYEIGGPDRVTYGDLMREYARQRGLRRFLIPGPLLTPRLSSLWLGLVTPLYARVGRKLVDSMRNPTVDPGPLRRRRLPRQAARRARGDRAGSRERGRRLRPDALVGRRLRLRADRALRRRPDRHALRRQPEDRRSGAPFAAFAPVRRIGGDAGWYHGNVLWRLRGFLDLLAGGVGLRRGRRNPDELREGDALDFWRVEAVEPNRLLRLRAEMRVPGRAWLQFEVTPVPGGTEIRQTAVFDASGLLGLAYWYALYPLHRFVFGGMLRGIVASALGAPEARTAPRLAA